MRPTLCSKCRQDLKGLPGRGKCPQCGQRYWIGRGTGIHREPSAATKGDRLVLRITTLVLAVAGSLILLTCLAFFFFTDKPGSLAAGISLGGVMLLFAGVNYLNMKSEKDQ